MPELHIKELTCVNQEDANPNPHDEANLQIDGITVSGPHPMATGDVIPLNVRHTFTGSVAVNLIEGDGAGVPDFIGTVVIPDTLPPFNNQTDTFSAALPHAEYSMVYDLHP